MPVRYPTPTMGVTLEPVAEPIGGFTARELDVVRFLAAGYTCREIGQCLCLTTSTVEGYTANITSKLGTTARKAIVAYAIERGLGPTVRSR